ncbi:hypothetical protein PYW07_011164 [Mythimna separata]|uniref:VWFD domain-containing protein n=1 Tax=Mythimna separata TaxID=271217 RepID=A0AAD7Y7D4_MYTSE|nr:hypothetical protein PYW07_011164 [Mythimna separata]
MFSINGRVSKSLPYSSIYKSLVIQLDAIYARNLDGSVGFLDTLTDMYTTVGVINKIQFYCPINMNTDLTSEKITQNVVLPDQDATFIHFSVSPYSTLQKTDGLLTVSQSPFTKYIERPAKVISGDYKIRLLGGVSILLQGYSYSSDFKDEIDIDDSSFLTDMSTLLCPKDVALTQFNLKYLAQETINKDITFSLLYRTLSLVNYRGAELGPASVVKDVSVSGEKRRWEFMTRVASGIESANVQLYDFSVVFNGKHKEEYVFTTAFANSFVDKKFQAIFFLNAREQINGVIKVVNPKTAPLNFNEALNNKINVTYEIDLKFGNSKNIQINGFGERSEKYTEMLLNDPLAKQCLQETSQFNFFQRDCYKMIIKAHAPDYLKFFITYEQLSPEFLIKIQETFRRLNKRFGGAFTQDIANKLDDGKLEIEVQSFYYDNYENAKFTSKYGELSFKNVEISDDAPYAMAIYAPITNWEHTLNYYSGHQYLPYCAVDSSKIQTFSGRSYDYSLTSSWHAVMVDESKSLHDNLDLVILARRPSKQQTEVYISYTTVSSNVELLINSTSVQIEHNSRVQRYIGLYTPYWRATDWHDHDVTSKFMQYYKLADGVLMFNFNGGALRLVYDGYRLAIFTSGSRSTTRGICGQSSSEIRDDYLTPYGVVDLPDLYGASFSLDGEFSDPKTVELKMQAKQKAYQPVTKYTNILRSDTEWSKAGNNGAFSLAVTRSLSRMRGLRMRNNDQ